MTSHSNRKDIRVATGPGFAISFRISGHGFRDIRIMNLSVGGCFALLDARTARFFLPGATLEDLVLHHPDLPEGPIIATVAYVLGYSPGGEGGDQVGMGLQFLGMEASTRLALEAWVGAATA